MTSFDTVMYIFGIVCFYGAGSLLGLLAVRRLTRDENQFKERL